MFLSGFGSREVFGEAFHPREGCCVLQDGEAGGRDVFGMWCTGAVAVAILGAVLCRGSGWLQPKISGVGTLWPGHFAIVMLGTPRRGTSLTVIWNNRYSIWKASRFQRASGPVVFTA